MWRLKAIKRKEVNLKVVFSAIILFLLLAVFIVGFYYLVLPPKLVQATPNSEQIDLKGRIEFTFNKPIDRNRITYEISPSVRGQIDFGSPLYQTHLTKSISFNPEEYFQPNTKYSLRIKNVGSFYNKKSREYSLDFQTKNIPEIQGFSIKNEQADLPPNANIEAFLDQPKLNFIDYNFSIEPKCDLMVSYDEISRKYLISASNGFAQGQKYTLRAQQIFNSGDQGTLNKEPLVLNFSAKNAPGIRSYSPSGSNVFVESDTILINFSDEMNKGDVLNNIKILPNPKGIWEWTDSKTLKYKLNEKLQYETAYNIKINKGTKDNSGGFLADDTNLPFYTIGRVKVSAVSPKNNSTGINTNATIQISFNQAVDHSSAQSSFSITPQITGGYTWQGEKLIFTPNTALAKNIFYKITIASGIKSIHGLDSSQNFESRFETEITSTILDVSQDYQDKPLSCEAASLKMALRYKGVDVSENDIMNIIGYDPTLHSGNTWGNPYNAFVGDINGRQNTTGYGVYWDPIAKAANQWRSAKAFSGWTAQDLAREINNGNPIMTWGIYGSGYYDPWYTPDGVKIDAWKGEHARTVIGFKGTVENPTEFILNDPYGGKLTWSTSKLLSDWGKFNYSGVVVY